MPITYFPQVPAFSEDSIDIKWGDISGLLDDQQDLLFALSQKSSVMHDHDQDYEPLDPAIQQHLSAVSNPHSVTKAQRGLGNVENFSIASQAEAEAGTVNDKYMTPLRTKHAMEAMGGSSGNSLALPVVTENCENTTEQKKLFSFSIGPDVIKDGEMLLITYMFEIYQNKGSAQDITFTLSVGSYDLGVRTVSIANISEKGYSIFRDILVRDGNRLLIGNTISETGYLGIELSINNILSNNGYITNDINFLQDNEYAYKAQWATASPASYLRVLSASALKLRSL